MSDPNMILNWSQNQPNNLLTNIGQGLRGLGGQVIDQVENRRYQGLLETAMDPATESPENWIAALNAAPEDQKQNAIQTYGIMQQKKKAQIEADAKANYDEALGAWANDPSAEGNLMNLLEAGSAIGKYDETQKKIAAMDSLAQKNQLQPIMEVYSQVYSGNTEMAIANLESQAQAYENDGNLENDGEIQGIRFMAQQLRDGKEKEILALTGINAGQLEGGKEALQTVWDINADYRAEIATGLDVAAGERAAEELKLQQAENKRADNAFALKVMETGAGLEKDQDALNAMTEGARNDPEFGEITLAALRYATALEGGLPLDDDEFNKTIIGLRNEWHKKSKDFTDFQSSNESLNNIIDSASAENDPNARGLIDITSINLFQRKIDPATVREGDVRLVQSAKSLAERLALIRDNWVEGDVLSPEQRQEMKDISKRLVIAKKAYVDEVIYPSINATHRRVDPSGNTYNEVFSGYTVPGNEPPPVTSDEDPNEPDVFKTDSASFFGGS